MSGLRVRRPSRDDVGALYALLQGKAEFDGAKAALTATADGLEAALFADSPGIEVRVAEEAGTLLGFVAYYPIFSTFAARPGLWMEDLFVLADHRGRGIGRALLRVVAEEALRRGCCKLEWSLQKRNARGIAFYEREGAVVREDNRFAKLDEAAMSRLVAERDGVDVGKPA